MRDQDGRYVSAGADGLSPWTLLRLITGVIGLVMVGFGGFGSIRYFFAILDVVKAPAMHTDLFDVWANTLGIQEIEIPVAGVGVPIGRPGAILFLVVVAFVLLRLLLGVMKGGLHLMTWAKSEKAAAHPTVHTAPSSP